MKKKLLMLAMWAFMGIPAFAQIADGDYYLYDAAKGAYLSRGADWGTRAATNELTGVPFTWNSAEGSFTFKDNSKRLFATGDGHVYTDNTSNSTGWVLTEKAGGYTIRYGADGKFLGYLDGTLTVDFVESEESAIVWRFLTPNEYASFKKADTANGYRKIIEAAGFTFGPEEFLEQVGKAFITKDMTDKVPTARFTGSIGSWTWDQVRKQDGQPAYGTDFAEVYQATGTMHQTITNVPKGLYRVTVNGFERNGSNDGCVTLGDAGYEIATASFEANGYCVPFASWYSGQTGGNNPNNTDQAVSKFNEGKYLNELYTYVGEDQQLTLKVNIPSHVGGRWVLFNNVTLTQLTEITDEDVTTLLASVPEGHMQQTVADELAAAKAALEAEKTVANYNALAAAIAVAKESIEAYADAMEGIVAAETFMKHNNFATAAAIAEYESTLNAISTKYNEKTLTTAEAKAVKSTFNFSISKWQSNSGIVGDYMASAWNFEKDSWNNVAYVNNWSTEGETDGSEFKVPFVEAFVRGSDLTARTLSATLPGLTPNAKYEVHIWSRVETTTDAAPVAEKITMKVGEGTPVDIAGGEKIGDTKRYHNYYTAVGKTDAEGNLNVTIDVAEGSNVHWLSFKNVTYAEVPVIPVVYNFNDSTELAVSNNSNAGDITNNKTFEVPGEMTISVNRSTTTSPNRMWDADSSDEIVKPQLRIYGGSLSVEVPEGKAIKSLEIAQSKWTANSNTINGVLASESKWEGNSTNVVLTVGSQVRINSISAVIEDADENTTTFVPNAANLEAAKALPFGKEIAIALDSAVVTLYSGKVYSMYSYLQDESGAVAADINISNLEIMGQGAVLSGTLYASVSYDEELGYKLGLSTNTGSSEITVGEKDSVVVGQVVALSKVVKSPQTYFAKYITLQDVEYNETTDAWGNVESAYLISGTDTINFFDTYYALGYSIVTSKIQKFKSVSGYVATYEGVAEFRPYGAKDIQYYPAVECANIAALKDVADGKDVKLTLDNAIVTVYTQGHMGMSCFIEDATGGIQLTGGGGMGPLALDPEATDIISALGIDNDSIRLSGTLYASLTNSYGSFSLSLNESTQNSEITKEKGVGATPTTLTIPAANEGLSRYQCCLVLVENVSFLEEGWDLLVSDGTNKMVVYDMFAAFMDPETNMSVMPDPTKKYDVVGVLMEYDEGVTCICPVAYTEKIANGIVDINDNAEMKNLKIWTVNGVKVDNVKNLKPGLYIINGKKVVIK